MTMRSAPPQLLPSSSVTNIAWIFERKRLLVRERRSTVPKVVNEDQYQLSRKLLIQIAITLQTFRYIIRNRAN